MVNVESIQTSFLKDHLSDLASVAETLALNIANLLSCHDQEASVDGDIVSGGYIVLAESSRPSGGVHAPAPAQPWQVLTAVDPERARLLLQHLKEQAPGKFTLSDWTEVTIDDVSRDALECLKQVGLSHGAMLLTSHCDICRDWH